MRFFVVALAAPLLLQTASAQPKAVTGARLVFEMFKVCDGKISAVDAFMKKAPAGTKWIWER